MRALGGAKKKRHAQGQMREVLKREGGLGRGRLQERQRAVDVALTVRRPRE
jgi:hypothetical protein